MHRQGVKQFIREDEAFSNWIFLIGQLNKRGLLDELAERVRKILGRSAADLPLACILEGGTWAAGREIAFERRTDGAPPLKIESDGTVF